MSSRSFFLAAFFLLPLSGFAAPAPKIDFETQESSLACSSLKELAVITAMLPSNAAIEMEGRNLDTPEKNPGLEILNFSYFAKNVFEMPTWKNDGATSEITYDPRAAKLKIQIRTAHSAYTLESESLVKVAPGKDSLSFRAAITGTDPEDDSKPDQKIKGLVCKMILYPAFNL